MVYVYDLLVNFNDVMYDFYDWKSSDSFKHIRKVLVFKVKTSILVDFMFRRVKVNKSFLELIKDKTQIFTTNGIDKIEYSCIISDGENSVILEFNSSGEVRQKSEFLVLEKMEISNICKNVKVSNIIYELIDNSYFDNRYIRDDYVNLKSILSTLELIKDDKEKIEYLYYELFNIEAKSDAYNLLVNSILNNDYVDLKSFSNVLNMLTVKK